MTGKPCWYLLILILLCFFCIAPVLAATWEENWSPWVTKTTTSGATINWRQATNGTGTIEYANASYYDQYRRFDQTITDAAVTQYHHVSITGLEQNTSYKYWVQPGGDKNEFNNRTFRTMPVSGPYTIIVIADSQEGLNYSEEKRFRYVADAIAQEPDVLFILHGGDNARLDETPNWAEYFYVADGMLANFTIYPTIGNHEYHRQGLGTPTNADHYRWAYDVPLNYSFDCAGIRYVSLDTPDPDDSDNGDPQPSLAIAERQQSWLGQVLNNSMAGTIVIQHYPDWDDGMTEARTNFSSWDALFHTYNITASFAGHLHNYQRLFVDTVPYFIVGNAGGPCNGLHAVKPPEFQFGTTRRLGYLRLSINQSNNTATAQSVIVGYVDADDDDETPHLYDPPVIDETITYPLSTKLPTPAPTVTGITPATGPTTGSTLVTITGTNLLGAGAVTFGGAPATNVVVVSSTAITAATPAHAAGTVDVTVTTLSGTSATSPADQFTYVVVPASASTAGIFRRGTFYLASNNTQGGGTVNAFAFGAPDDVPIAGDWIGGSIDTVGIFRQGTFYFASNNTQGGGTVNAFAFGAPNDVPIAGDWTGSGFDTVGVFRQGTFYLASSNQQGGGTVNAFAFGAAGDIPVVWHHDGKDTVGIFRQGTFYLASDNQEGGGTVNAFAFGAASDIPVDGTWI